jgi:hypothetical protein
VLMVTFWKERSLSFTRSSCRRRNLARASKACITFRWNCTMVMQCSSWPWLHPSSLKIGTLSVNQINLKTEWTNTLSVTHVNSPVLCY